MLAVPVVCPLFITIHSPQWLFVQNERNSADFVILEEYFLFWHDTESTQQTHDKMIRFDDKILKIFLDRVD